MINNTFFLHINSANLPGYYSCACLKPAKYFPNRIVDVQNSCEAVILLSSKRYAKQEDCSLEVVLTSQEKDNLIPVINNKALFIFNNPLPLSRVVKIYFKSADTKDKITTLVNLSSGFIPDKLATFIVDSDTVDYQDIELPENLSFLDFTKSIKKYDSLLGGFALMRLAGDENMNYSENYFSTLSRFNSVIENELLNANKQINGIFWDAFEGKSSFKNLFPYINKTITSDDLAIIAREEGQKISKSTLSGVIDINSLDRGTYVVAVLYSFGMSDEGRKGKIDGLILNNFKKDIRSDKSEVIALCYGLNRGYTVFTNKYKTSLSEKIVKFELNSQLDYYTIESIYQYSFNNIEKSNEFPYLDPWCPKFQKLNRKLKKSEYLILDKVITTGVTKVGSAKWWAEIMQSFFSKTGEDLFRPFLEKIFEKLKSDIESEFQDILFEKDEVISELKIENSKLNCKNNEVNSLRAQIEILQNEIETLKSKSNSAAEPVIEYSSASNQDSYTIDLQIKLNELQRLINSINKQTQMKVVKELIKKFNEPEIPET